MAALSVGNTSAAVDENGYYVPEEGESTNRYYFAMPNTWRNKYTDTAGVYFMPTAETCGFVEGKEPISWPGYKAYFDGYKSYAYSIYYVDCPTDIEFIVWNNYIKSGATDDTAMSDAEKQSDGVNTEFCSLYDYDIYDAEWFAEMEESYNGDKKALGSYADNFFYDEEYGSGFSFNFDNMIYVVPQNADSENSSVTGIETYKGNWYFFYGEDEYGTYPTREESEKNNTLYSLCPYAVIDDGGIGDVDGNGVTDVSDATTIQKYLAGLIELTDRQRRVADVDKTGVVDIFDATAIKYLLVGRGIGYWCD
ncbi:MAG: dockerin type I repeat-containing protein [Ruminococcus sp.]|nr:dockerin type I repeat-containing protein [Ruminococcus sp.]